MPMDWRTAYLEQARSDYEMLLRLMKEEDIPPCQSLHYLQMTTEKLSKALKTRHGNGRPPKVHDAFAIYVRKYAVLDQDLRDACGFKNQNQYKAYLDGLKDLAKQIEDLSPEGDDHANPEYPWKQDDGSIIAPLSYPFQDLDLRQQSAKMTKLLKFIAACFTLT